MFIQRCAIPQAFSKKLRTTAAQVQSWSVHVESVALGQVFLDTSISPADSHSTK
jgi:hypothetical protein